MAVHHLLKNIWQKATIQHEMYPDGYARGLRKKLAEKHGVDEDASFIRKWLR